MGAEEAIAVATWESSPLLSCAQALEQRWDGEARWHTCNSRSKTVPARCSEVAESERLRRRECWCRHRVLSGENEHAGLGVGVEITLWRCTCRCGCNCLLSAVSSSPFDRGRG